MAHESDLYSLLGVLPDAEAIVITAAYRALASRYHPDKWSGAVEFAHTRMADINRAYAVLGDPSKRNAYDAERDSSKDTFYEAPDEQEAAFKDALAQVEERWNVATDIFPSLVETRQRLAKTSHTLAFAFVTLLLESKRFSEAAVIADQMERSFLQRYFGTNERILGFVRELIFLGLKDAVKALNRLVEVLGSEVDPMPLITKISRDFDVKRHRGRAQEKARIGELKERLRTHPYTNIAAELASLLGYSVNEVAGSFFKNPTYQISKSGVHGLIASFASGEEFVEWVRQTAT